MSHPDRKVVRIETPLPFRPRSVNAFLVPLEEGGSMLVDGGFDTDDAWTALVAGVEDAGGWSEVRLHVVTHMHLDHIGLVHRVRAVATIPLAMGQLDAERAAHAAANPAEEQEFRAELLRSNGAPDEDVTAVGNAAADPNANAHFVEPDLLLPSDTAPVPGATGWSSVWTPGHTAGHTALFRTFDRTLIAGDAIIPRVSPTIGVNRQRPDPVGDYLQALSLLESLEPLSVFGGHGEQMQGIARAAELRAEVIAEGQRIRGLVGAEPTSAWEVAQRRYHGRELPLSMRLLAFRETLAHLARLTEMGIVRKEEQGGVIRFALE